MTIARLNRRVFTVGTGAALVSSFAIGRARAAEFTYKLGNNAPAGHPINVRAMEAAARIKDETKGRFELQVFPNSQLGSDTDMLGQARSGALDFLHLSGLILSIFVPTSAISGVGFAFDSYDTVWKGLDGKLGAFIRGEVAKSRQLVAFEKVWDNGYRQTTTSTRPIVSPTDFDGTKLRVPPAALWTSMFKAFGAAPVTINFNEVYSALQSKVVDGQENPLPLIESAKLYEVQSFCSTTNHMWDGYWLLANRRSWEAVPEDIQAIVSRCVNDAALAERQDIAAAGRTVRETLTKDGLKFNDIGPDPFRDKLRKAGFYEEWKKKFGDQAWSALEDAVGKLS